MSRRDLRKEQTALRSAANEQAVTTDLDLFGEDSERRREQRYLDMEMVEVVRRQWTETWVVQGSSRGAPYETIAERLVRLRNAYASAQSLAHVKTDEHASLLRENAARGNLL